jgi:hypothetical protein
MSPSSNEAVLKHLPWSGQRVSLMDIMQKTGPFWGAELE